MKIVGFVLLILSSVSFAQDYPVKPVTAIIPFSSGSASDVIARLVLERMGTSMGKRFVVTNIPAAGGVSGTLTASKADPDGYTIVMGAAGPTVVNKILNPKLGYDPEKDFEPISLYASLPNIVVVNSKLPINNLAEFVDYVRKISIASGKRPASKFFSPISPFTLSISSPRSLSKSSLVAFSPLSRRS